MKVLRGSDFENVPANLLESEAKFAVMRKKHFIDKLLKRLGLKKFLLFPFMAELDQPADFLQVIPHRDEILRGHEMSLVQGQASGDTAHLQLLHFLGVSLLSSRT